MFHTASECGISSKLLEHLSYKREPFTVVLALK